MLLYLSVFYWDFHLFFLEKYPTPDVKIKNIGCDLKIKSLYLYGLTNVRQTQDWKN